MKKENSVPDLFLQFFIFGCFTFGGGWSIVAQMNKIYVEKRKTITNAELLDLTSVGRSLPGTMIGNVAVLFGHRIAGIPGALACLFGMVLPPMIVLSIITCFYTAFRENLWIAAAMNGIRAAVVPIIFSAALSMVRGAFGFPPCILVAAVTFALYLFLNVNCVYLVLFGAVCGILISEYYERKRRNAA